MLLWMATKSQLQSDFCVGMRPCALEDLQLASGFIKDSKAKVQASIQGDIVRVSGRDRDTLQDIIAKLKDKDFGIHMQFTNYRSN